MLHYFPLVMVVHGVLVASTVVPLYGSQAIVVPAVLADVCDARPEMPRRIPTLCSDTMNRLGGLARRLK